MIRKLMPCIRSALAGLILSVFSLAVWAGEISPPESAAATGTPGATEALPKMVVHKTPYCGCCEQWVEHMKHAGFDVEVREVENLAPIKEALGVPAGTGSCHTAEVGRYFVEGHVPAEDIKRLLAEQRSARGLATPGMPAPTLAPTELLCDALAVLDWLVASATPWLCELPVEEIEPYVTEFVHRIHDSLSEAVRVNGEPYLRARDAAGLCAACMERGVVLPVRMLLKMCQTIIQMSTLEAELIAETPTGECLYFAKMTVA